jgi:hypothetical protein
MATQAGTDPRASWIARTKKNLKSGAKGAKNVMKAAAERAGDALDSLAEQADANLEDFFKKVKWSMGEVNVTRLLYKAIQTDLTHIYLPSMKYKVEFELEEVVFRHIQKDERKALKLFNVLATEQNALISETAKKLKEIDAEAAQDAQKAAHAVEAADAVLLKLSDELDALSSKMEAEATAVVREYIKGQNDLRETQLKGGVKIAINVVAIGTATAIVVASHGTLTPFGGLAIGRSVVAIGQEMTKLATNCDEKAKVIKFDFAVLRTFIGKTSKDKAQADLLERIKTNGPEVALATISGALGIESPSLKNCRKHIEAHEVDIAKLEAESLEYTAQINKLIEKVQSWEGKLKLAIEENKRREIRRLQKAVATCEGAIDLLLGGEAGKSRIQKVDEAIHTAHALNKQWLADLDVLAQGVEPWTKYVDIGVNMTVNIALAVGSPDAVFEPLANAFISVSNDALQEVVEATMG